MVAGRSCRNLFFSVKNRSSMSNDSEVRPIDRESRDGDMWPFEKRGSPSVRLGGEEHINCCGSVLQKSFFLVEKKFPRRPKSDQLDGSIENNETERYGRSRSQNVSVLESETTNSQMVGDCPGKNNHE